MSDSFALYQPGLDSPPGIFVAITPSDSLDLTTYCRALFVGSSGDITITGLDGNIVTFSNVAGGAWFPLRAQRIWATGTTATNLIAGY